VETGTRSKAIKEEYVEFTDDDLLYNDGLTNQELMDWLDCF
jgi:hypothetical protein